ncbi:MAG: cytidine deaminase [Bacteroidales bacterium]|nr:cytidine deaminase [Bacteroidales bacterium]MDD3011674.1 cytidine deaminase [Bacteroidales bacterium]MDD3961500.1 cytidine deaminase [Bacteroidales bacterium]MDY0287146.1 cytidine deaminase [Bacteroidales bacterium]
MKIKKILIPVEEYLSSEELPPKDRMLLSKAVEAIEGSYAPYSGYQVGAAVLLENGEIFLGGNQENAAYPSGLCAERVALFAAATNYPHSAIKSIAITASTERFALMEPVTPCGACRQVMAEAEMRHRKPIRVIMGNPAGKIFVTEQISHLLPLMFTADELKKKRE